MAVTRTRSPSGAPCRDAIAACVILAFVRPYGSISSPASPTCAAISAMGRSLAAWAISMSGGCAGLIGSPVMARSTTHTTRLPIKPQGRVRSPTLVVAPLPLRGIFQEVRLAQVIGN